MSEQPPQPNRFAEPLLERYRRSDEEVQSILPPTRRHIFSHAHHHIRLARIAALNAQIKELQEIAIEELMEKRNSLSQQLAQVDTEIAQLKGESLTKPKRKYSRAAIVTSTPTLAELTDLLSGLDGKALNLRKEGIDVKHVRSLVAKQPGVLTFSGKGAWPEITLVK